MQPCRLAVYGHRISSMPSSFRKGTPLTNTLPQKLEQLSLTTMSHRLDQTIADAAVGNLSFAVTLERLSRSGTGSPSQHPSASQKRAS
jgi:hypothetical protein